MISDNIKSVRQRIARCCEKIGRRPEDVELVCVTKEAASDEIETVLALGVKVLGENKVQDLVSKYNIIGKRVLWHLIGHLQTNKVKDAVAIVSLIHSVDSIHLAKEIDRRAHRINKIQDILIQVNVSGEKSKFGIRLEDVFGVISQIVSYSNISIRGLMTIAPEAPDPEAARPYFRALRELRDRISLENGIASGRILGPRNDIDRYPVLSMGMSNDFETAIEEGSNMVRIGRAIFGDGITA